jgi:hypothetical protein
MSIPVNKVGDLVKFEATFVDEDDLPVDPTTVTLKVMDPSGNIDEYTYSASVSRDDVGIYWKNVAVDEPGDWRGWWESTGTGQGAEQTQFVVEPTPFD